MQCYLGCQAHSWSILDNLGLGYHDHQTCFKSCRHSSPKLMLKPNTQLGGKVILHGGCDFSSSGDYKERIVYQLLDLEERDIGVDFNYYGRILRRLMLNCMFAPPVYVQRNCQYKIIVSVHNDGYYSSGRASNSVIGKGVQLNLDLHLKTPKIRALMNLVP